MLVLTVKRPNSVFICLYVCLLLSSLCHLNHMLSQSLVKHIEYDAYFFVHTKNYTLHDPAVNFAV